LDGSEGTKWEKTGFLFAADAEAELPGSRTFDDKINCQGENKCENNPKNSKIPRAVNKYK